MVRLSATLPDDSGKIDESYKKQKCSPVYRDCLCAVGFKRGPEGGCGMSITTITTAVSHLDAISNYSREFSAMTPTFLDVFRCAGHRRICPGKIIP